MQKFVYSSQSVVLTFSLWLILSIVPPNALIAEIVNRQTYNAQLTEMRIRTCGHVRLALKLWGDSHKYTKSLELILDSCPTFFATKNRATIFAISIRKVEANDFAGLRNHNGAIRILGKQGLTELLNNQKFRTAIMIYVDEAKMIDKANLLWEEAEKIVDNLREVATAHACSLVSRNVTKVCSTFIEQGNPLNGCLDKLLLDDLKGLLPPDIGCPGTGVADYYISSNGTVTCKNHGTFKAAEEVSSPISSGAMAQYTEQNPFLWALDHVMRMQASKSCLSRIRKRDSKK